MNSSTLLESCAREVLGHYTALPRGNLVFLGNHGGFSGAGLWRLETPAGSYCLKAWPKNWRSPRDLAWIHALMQQASAFPWMPRVMPASNGETFLAATGRLWDLTTWMPGVSDFSQKPSAARLEAACTALALLHQAWTKHGQISFDVCPAVVRRWESLTTWQALLQSGWRPACGPLDLLATCTEELWQLLKLRIGEVPRLLAPWLGQSVAIQPCICDLWHDHVLYQDDAVSGIIDFGSAKTDHVAVDLARLLGSMVPGDEAMWDIGLSAYHRLRPLSLLERELARDLDVTGSILAATHWLRWLYHDQRRHDLPEAVRARLTQLVQRLRMSEPEA